MAATNQTSSQYFIDVGDDTIQTLVTNSPLSVDSWISEIEHIHRHRLNRLVVGLDVEWRPSFSRRRRNPLAILQLCVGRRCLVFQLLHSPYVPDSLVEFLSDVNYTFVGVGIPEDMRRLEEELDLKLSNAVDLALVAESLYGDKNLRFAGLKSLASRVLGLKLEKPRRVALSGWDNRWLSDKQIEYACADAWASFEIGRCFRAWEY
ncbi:hypothetical protein UlMin_006490 [Ulmus minor]